MEGDVDEVGDGGVAEGALDGLSCVVQTAMQGQRLIPCKPNGHS